MRSTSSSRRSRTIRVPLTQATCLTLGHDWDTTICPGMFYCTRCGLTALCPGCIPVLPSTETRITYCPKHRRAFTLSAPKGVQA